METEKNIEPLEVQVLEPTVLAQLERAEIDCQISTARRFPRSLEHFKRKATEYATLDEETAASCIYKRPVGGGKIAEGESIRLAEIVAACYGNIRVASRIIEQTDRYVKTEGVAHDLESNTAGRSEVIESTVDKNGVPYTERMRIVIAKAALSKAYRDAVFRVCPKALCKSIVEAARKVIIGDEKTLETRRGKVRDWVKSLKIDEHRVFVVLGIKGWNDLGTEHLETLTGLRTAIQDGDTTVDEAFPQASKSSKILEKEKEAASKELLPE